MVDRPVAEDRNQDGRYDTDTRRDQEVEAQAVVSREDG